MGLTLIGLMGLTLIGLMRLIGLMGLMNADGLDADWTDGADER